MLLIGSGAVLLAGFAFLTFFGGGRVTTNVTRTGGAGVVSLPAVPLREVRPFSLTNQLAEPVGLESLKGRPWAVNLIFTRCPGPCAQLSGVMRTLQKRIPEGSKAGLMSLTSDPEHDNPGVLAAYGARFEADARRWQLVTGTRAEIRRLATEDLMMVLQDKAPELRESPEDLFLHSTLIVLLDGRGRVRQVVEGLEPGAVDRVLALLAELEREGEP